MNRKTPNAQHRTPNIRWFGVREGEAVYFSKTTTSNAQRSTPNAQRSTPNAQRQNDQRFDLEDRLLGFSARIVRLVDSLPNTRAANHIAGQLLRCGTSPYGNHGEVEAAESRRDFVHKLGVCLKELRDPALAATALQSRAYFRGENGGHPWGDRRTDQDFFLKYSNG